MRSPEPFHFWTRLTLTKLTGRRAADLPGLLEHLREVPGSVIFQHTHHFLVQHQHLSPEPPNDFAFWVSNVLQEEHLGERLAAIDTVRFSTIRALREELIAVIAGYLEEQRALRTAPAGEEFHFMHAVSFALPTSHRAHNLDEFATCLREVGLASISFHLFEARLRIGTGDNDFSNWLRTELGEARLADDIVRLDPYTYTLEGLRARLIQLVTRRLEERNGNPG